MSEQTYYRFLRFSIILSLTLGLAPFFPEPHVVGKVRWVLGGAEGMRGIDWFDLALHGIPWLTFFLLLIYGLLAGYLPPAKRRQ